MLRHASLKSFALSFAVSTFLLVHTESADAAVVVIGDSAGRICYLAARSGVGVLDGIKTCDQALEEHEMTAKDTAATHVNRGVLYDSVGRYSEAFDDFNTSIAEEPDLGDGYLNRGVALIRLNRSQEAYADIQKGITLGVSTPEIGFYDRAVAEEQLGRITEAYYDYKRTLEALPGFTPASEALKRFVVTSKPAQSAPAARN